MVKKPSRRLEIERKKRKRRSRFKSTTAERPSLTDQILAFLAKQQDAVTLTTIANGLHQTKTARNTIKEILTQLTKSGKILQVKRRYLPAGESGLLQATLDLTAKGFGFAMVEGAGAGEKDVFIAPPNLNNASHGDTILITITGVSRGRREGRVVKILNRAISKLCGIYNKNGKTGFVSPDNERLPYTVQIKKGATMAARDGTCVLVEITDYGTDRHGPEGKIIELLGDPETVPVQIRMAIEQFELSLGFPQDVEQEVEHLTSLTSCTGSRQDLRHIQHVTIDGETAKDFDDAIAVETTKNGFRLYVSIADVSHYVQPGSAIDSEAYRRGTSVYLPDLVLPMLPERLSNNLCSLVPDQDRPAFTAILDFNRQGKRIGEQFTKSMIKSRQRFTYAEVNRILYLNEDEARNKYRHLLPMLDSAKKLSKSLHRQRMKRGSLGFNIPEATITIEDNSIAAIGRTERNQAHMLIEECMLAANEAVAEILDKARKPVLFRVHERPDPAKVEAFTEAAKSMGLQLPKTDITPAWFARVLDEAHKSPAEYVVNNLLLRTMQQARYSPENLGHFGLAADFYLHFTSPIRRYPDLVAHRVLQNFLLKHSGQAETVSILPGNTKIQDSALHLSKRERVAVNVERNVRSRLSALFLHDRIGEEFDAIISGVTSFGLFVELLEFFISGAVPIREMRDDYYLFDSRAHRLVGERTNTIFQLGNLVQVRLDRVDMTTKRITFSLSTNKEDDNENE